MELFVGEGGHGSLTEEVCKTLLLEAPPSADYDITPDEIEPACFEGGLAILSGYPDCPLYHRLSDAMAYWIITGYVVNKKFEQRVNVFKILYLNFFQNVQKLSSF